MADLSPVKGLESSPSAVSPPHPPPAQSLSLVQPSTKKKCKAVKVFRLFRSVFRSFPIMTPAACKFSFLPGGNLPDTLSAVDNRITGKLFGYRKGRVSLSIQETSGTCWRWWWSCQC
ncbi:Uncharacterized protein Fot_30438 [Forsythia ovata]|uniref:Uncharacterized protein n=1 Tax=Forsythia ovata TaxID=205694 RepID=A0ABD1TUR5_9LAMI